jgi:hypothetical protein
VGVLISSLSSLFNTSYEYIRSTHMFVSGGRVANTIQADTDPTTTVWTTASRSPPKQRGATDYAGLNDVSTHQQHTNLLSPSSVQDGRIGHSDMPQQRTPYTPASRGRVGGGGSVPRSSPVSVGRSVAMVSALLNAGPLTQTYAPSRTYSMPAYWEAPTPNANRNNMGGAHYGIGAPTNSPRGGGRHAEASTLSPVRRTTSPTTRSHTNVNDNAPSAKRSVQRHLQLENPSFEDNNNYEVVTPVSKYARHHEDLPTPTDRYDPSKAVSTTSVPFYSEASLNTLLRSASRLTAHQQRQDLSGGLIGDNNRHPHHGGGLHQGSNGANNAPTPYGNIAELHYLKQRVASLEQQLRYSHGEKKFYDGNGEIMVRASKVFSSRFYQTFLYERLLRAYFRRWLLFFRYVRQGLVGARGSPRRHHGHAVPVSGPNSRSLRDRTMSPSPTYTNANTAANRGDGGDTGYSSPHASPLGVRLYGDSTPAYVVDRANPRLPPYQAPNYEPHQSSPQGIRDGIMDYYSQHNSVIPHHIPGGGDQRPPRQQQQQHQQLVDAATAEELRLLNDVEMMHSRLTRLEQGQDEHAHVVGVVFEHVVETGYRLEALEEQIKRHKGDLKFAREQAEKYEREGRMLGRKQIEVDDKLAEIRLEMETTDEANKLLLLRREAELRTEWERISSDRVEQERRRAEAELQQRLLSQKLHAEQERFFMMESLRLSDGEARGRSDLRVSEQDARNDLLMLLTTLKTLAKEREDRRRWDDSERARREDDRRREIERLASLLRQLERQEDQERRVGIMAEESEAREVLKKYEVDDARAVSEMVAYRERVARDKILEELRVEHDRRITQGLEDIQVQEQAARSKVKKAAINGSLMIATEAAEEAAMLEPVYLE